MVSLKGFLTNWLEWSEYYTYPIRSRGKCYFPQRQLKSLCILWGWNKSNLQTGKQSHQTVFIWLVQLKHSRSKQSNKQGRLAIYSQPKPDWDMITIQPSNCQYSFSLVVIILAKHFWSWSSLDNEKAVLKLMLYVTKSNTCYAINSLRIWNI